MELSTLQPRLAAANCRLLAVGLEELGQDDFLAGGYFKGDVVVDIGQKSFKALGFKKMNILSLGSAMLSKSVREAISKVKSQKIKNDLKGDAMQNGGLLVVAKGGSQVLYEYRQENPAEHAPNSDILQALGLPAEDPTPSSPTDKTNKPAVVCNDDVCAMPAK